jgi:hypothetical protein
MTLDELQNLKLRDNDNEFTHCGTITVDQHQFTPDIIQDTDEAGVYLWVSRDENDSYEPLYVGKAKNGPRSRLSQHKSGINKNTVTAEARRTQILECIPNEGSLEVFFRASPTMNFLGVNNVSTYSLDEEAFILRFLPPLNRSRPPVVEVPNGESLIEAMTDRFDHYYDESQWNAWIHYLNSLSPGRKELVEGALRKTQELAGGGLWSLDIGVTGSYTLGPSCQGMSGRPVLVFGRYVNVQFAANGKFALLALDEGSDAEQQPDILFYREGQQDAVCYSYEQFRELNDNYEFDSSIANQLAQVLQDIQERDHA